MLTVHRYVERNALRAQLAAAAEAWRWGSLWQRQHPDGPGRPELADGPLVLPQNWVERDCECAAPAAEESALRRSIRRGQPFGKQEWAESVVKAFALESTQRSQGRPRKHIPSGPLLLFENGS